MTKFVRSPRSNVSTHIQATPITPGSAIFLAMPTAPHILIVDDHREIRDLVSRALTKEGFRVSVAPDGRAMRKVLADSHIDLVLLDLMLPGEDGLSLCRSIRAGSLIPIIMLTAKGDEVDRVIGLEMGADDYLPKPFGSRELVARIRAVLRRSRDTPSAARPNARPKQYHFDRWRLDIGARDHHVLHAHVAELQNGAQHGALFRGEGGARRLVGGYGVLDFRSSTSLVDVLPTPWTAASTRK